MIRTFKKDLFSLNDAQFEEIDALLNDGYEIITQELIEFADELPYIFMALYKYTPDPEYTNRVNALKRKSDELVTSIREMVEREQVEIPDMDPEAEIATMGAIQAAVASTITEQGGYPDTLPGFINMVNNGDFVVLDTETTGLHQGEICQIAIIDSAGMTQLNTYVKPVNPIPADATRVHGITNEMVKDAPSWEEVTTRVETILKGRHVVVYNAKYDRKIMHQSAEAANLPKVDWKTFSRWWCAMEHYAEYHGDWNDYHQSYRWQRLGVAAERFGISSDGAHDALADCKMTLGVVYGMNEEYDDESNDPGSGHILDEIPDNADPDEPINVDWNNREPNYGRHWGQE